MIRLFATDLDGTLLLSSIPGADSKIIQSLTDTMKKGYEIALVTGRNLTEIKMEDDLWNLPVSIISMNGGLLLNKNREVIQKNVFPKEALMFLVHDFFSFPFEYLGAENKWVSTSREVLRENYYHCAADILNREGIKETLENLLDQNEFNCTEEYLINQEIYKIDFMCCDENIYHLIQEKVESKYPNQFHIVFDGMSVEISYHTVNKGKALKTLCSYLAIAEDETMVFGDSANDVAMLQAFKHSRAVENANEQAKKIVEKVIGKNNDYAVIQEIVETIANQR